MPKIIIAGDSWGAHSFEYGYQYPDLEGFKWAEKKTYVLYPGPGHFLQQLINTEVVTTADHGVSNSEAFDNLRKVLTKDDTVIFYQTGVLREIHRAYTNKKNYYTTNDCARDYEHYAKKFYDNCRAVDCKHFALIGGCAKVDEIRSHDINVIEHSITTWIDPKFNDSVYDTTHWWLDSVEPKLYSSDEFYKQGVIDSAEKVEFWASQSEYHRAHPTVATNKIIAKRLYDYLKSNTSLN